MVFKFCRALHGRGKARPEGCTVHDPGDKNRCWGVVQRGRLGGLTQPMQCASKARHQKLTCYSHRGREAEARALLEGSGVEPTIKSVVKNG